MTQASMVPWLQRWLSARDQKRYIKTIVDTVGIKGLPHEDNDVVESIEHEEGTHDITADVDMYESEIPDGNGVQLNVPEGSQQELAFTAASAGHEYTEITLSETELSYLEDTSVLIQNHTPTNPFVADTVPSRQASRRQQTPFASRVPMQSDGIVHNLFDNTPRLVPTPYNMTVSVRRDSLSRTRGLDDKAILLTDEDSFVSERGQDSEASIVAQTHFQGGVTTGMNGQDILKTEEDEMLLD